MQICIDPIGPGGIDENLHRSSQGWEDGCKFASIPQALGGSMQICIDPTNAEGIDAIFHRSIDANLHRSH